MSQSAGDTPTSQGWTRQAHAKPGRDSFDEIALGAGGNYADISLPTGAAISRESLDAALVQAAIEAGAQFLPNATAALLPLSAGGDRRTMRLRIANRDDAVEARIVLLAGGLGSKLEESPDEDHNGEAARSWQPGSRVGAGVMLPASGNDYEPGIIYMACGEEGYVGQTVVEDGRIDTAAALDPMAVKRAGGTGELATAILERAGFPVLPGLARLSWKGTPHLTRQAPRLGGERLFVLGDAAGYIEPFTGEGMAWALAGAGIIAPLALRGVRHGWHPDLLVRWRSAYHRKVTRRQIICRITADLLRRPIATQVMVRSLSLAPWLSRPCSASCIATERNSMSLAIQGLGTALPATRMLQGEAAEAAKLYCAQTDEQRQLLSVLYRQTEIETRHIVFQSDKFREVIKGGQSESEFARRGNTERGPSTSQRMERYHKEAVPLALESSRKALAEAGMKPNEITHLVTVSCTGFRRPAWTLGSSKGSA